MMLPEIGTGKWHIISFSLTLSLLFTFVIVEAVYEAGVDV